MIQLLNVAFEKINKIFLILVVTIFYSNSYAMSDYEVCEARAAIVYLIAVKRDSGESKQQVKKYFLNKFNNRLPDSFDMYIESVYMGEKATPLQMQKISLKLCHEEFDLR